MIDRKAPDEGVVEEGIEVGNERGARVGDNGNTTGERSQSCSYLKSMLETKKSSFHLLSGLEWGKERERARLVAAMVVRC